MIQSTPETVKVETLDHVMASDPAEHIFLKIDTQGFEQEVLEGSIQTMPRVEAIYAELTVEHLYQNVWSFPEAIAYFDALGFVPAQIRPVNQLRDDRSSASEFDCLFRRKPS